MTAPRLFGEQRVPIASWAKAHEIEQPYVPGRNRYDDDDFQPAHVDSIDGSSYGELPQGNHYVVDSGRGRAAPCNSVGVEPIRLTLDALKCLDESSTARECKSEPTEPEDGFAGMPDAEVMPGDAVSIASSGNASGKSCADWKAHITKMFKHRSDFISSTEAWSETVENEAPYQLTLYYSPRQLSEGTVMDPATGTVTKPPEASRIRVDESESESESLKQCRATQTTNSVCAMKSLQSQQLIELESPVLAASQVCQVSQLRPASPAIPAIAESPATPTSPASKQTSKQVHPQSSAARVARVAHIDRVDLQAAVAAVAAVSPTPAQAVSPEAGTASTATGRVPSASKVPARMLDKDHAPAVCNEAAEKPQRHEQFAQAKTPAARDKDIVNLCYARESDIDVMLKIYNEEVLKGTQALGGELATAGDFESLLAACRAAGLPLITAVVARDKRREAVGLAYLSKARATWKNAIAPVAEPRTVQAHVYVRMRYRGRGIGSMLMSALMGAVSQVPRAGEGGHVSGTCTGTCTGTNAADADTDRIEFVTVEVLCGSENGMMEREYERVLTQSFGFHAHPDPCDTMHWSKKTSRWLKTQKYYYACHKAPADGDEDRETEVAEAAEVAEGDAESGSSTKLLAV